MKDELGITVTPERIAELEQHFMFRSDTASRDVGLILTAQHTEIERLRAAIRDALDDLDHRDEIGAVEGLQGALKA